MRAQDRATDASPIDGVDKRVPRLSTMQGIPASSQVLKAGLVLILNIQLNPAQSEHPDFSRFSDGNQLVLDASPRVKAVVFAMLFDRLVPTERVVVPLDLTLR